MSDEAIQFGLTTPFEATPRDQKIFGVTLAVVIDNMDITGEGRVQLMLPWMPGFTPWARVAVLSAGSSCGTYFIPQIDDEVLVAFNHGDVREPFVIGSLWSTLSRPPALSPLDPVNLRRVRTPKGHELSFDDMLMSVTLTSNAQTTVTLDTKQAKLSTPSASVTIGIGGDVTISAATKLTLEAPIVEIKASGSLNVESQLAATFKAGATCTVQGATVKIN